MASLASATTRGGTTSRWVPGAVAASAVLYALLAAAGDLRTLPWLLVTSYLALSALAGCAYLGLRGKGEAHGRAVLASALLFRVVTAVGEPALSDDVYRYVWDGRLQLRGIHPYRHAPADPELTPYRDNVWERINHPETPTIYPPLAQMTFAALAGVGLGPRGFKLAMGLLDMGVVLVLARLLRRLGFPRDRLVLYAWNPVVVLETAGSGHVEPLGVLLVLAFVLTVLGERPATGAAFLGMSVQAKLLPAVLVPGALRRMRVREAAVLLAVVAALAAPYALTGPALGAGLEAYLTRWEGNSVVFEPLRDLLESAGVGERLKVSLARLQVELPDAPLPWEFLYRHVWPGDVARALLLFAALAWALRISFRPELDAAREAFFSLGGLLLLSPTFKPWYALWVLPFAAAYVSRGWLLLGALLPLSYLAGEGPVPWAIRLLEFGPPLLLMGWDGAAARRRRRGRVC